MNPQDKITIAITDDRKALRQSIAGRLIETGRIEMLFEAEKGTPQYPASYGFGNDFPIGMMKQ